MDTPPAPVLGWERSAQAVEIVRDRLCRVTQLLNQASIEYAVIGGNAVAEWVGRVDTSVVRNTQDVDILLRRQDLERAKVILGQGGFVYRFAAGINMFLDGPRAKARDAVHVALAGEKVRKEYAVVAPDVTQTQSTQAGFRVLDLDALVRMKLTSFRDKDRMHLRDLMEVGLIDKAWKEKFSSPLSDRLQQILDTPDG